MRRYRECNSCLVTVDIQNRIFAFLPCPSFSKARVMRAAVMEGQALDPLVEVYRYLHPRERRWECRPPPLRSLSLDHPDRIPSLAAPRALA